jgi:hypothetical protein
MAQDLRERTLERPNQHRTCLFAMDPGDPSSRSGLGFPSITLDAARLYHPENRRQLRTRLEQSIG